MCESVNSTLDYDKNFPDNNQTRTIAILPTFMIALYENIQSLSGMNDLLNCLMSLMLPFAVIPAITFTSNYNIMGEFTNGLISKLFAVSLSTLVIAVNIYFVMDYVVGLGITNVFFIIFLLLVGLWYVTFCSYLTLAMVNRNKLFFFLISILILFRLST